MHVRAVLSLTVCWDSRPDVAVATAHNYMSFGIDDEILCSGTLSTKGEKMQRQLLAEDGTLGDLLWFYMCAPIGSRVLNRGVGDECLTVNDL